MFDLESPLGPCKKCAKLGCDIGLCRCRCHAYERMRRSLRASFGTFGLASTDDRRLADDVLVQPLVYPPASEPPDPAAKYPSLRPPR